MKVFWLTVSSALSHCVCLPQLARTNDSIIISALFSGWDLLVLTRRNVKGKSVGWKYFVEICRTGKSCDIVMCSTVMKPTFTVTIFCLFASALSVINENELTYNNQFAVHIPNATEVLVQLIADKHGFRSLGQVTAISKKCLYCYDILSK